MSKKPETVFVPDEKINELRRMFLEKMEREASKIPGKLGDQWKDLSLNGIECITRRYLIIILYIPITTYTDRHCDLSVLNC